MVKTFTTLANFYRIVVIYMLLFKLLAYSDFIVRLRILATMSLVDLL